MGSRRNSYGLVLIANALPVIGHVIPTPPPAPTSSASAVSCTTVLTSTLSGFRGEWKPEIAETVYTSTATETRHVPCGGCALSMEYVLARPWGGIGPEERVTGTVTATTPFTTTTTVCEVTATVHRGPPPPQEKEYHAEESRGVTPAEPAVTPSAKLDGNEPANNPRAAPPPSNCTYTTVTPVSVMHGGTRTAYRSTVTYTSHINCNGCQNVAVSTFNPFHPGPVIFFNATTTVGASTTTTFQCLKTPSAVAASPTPTPGHHTRDEEEANAVPRAVEREILDASTMTFIEASYEHPATAVQG